MCVACATDWKNIIPIYSPVGYSPSQLYHCPQFTYGSSRPSGMKDVNLSTRNQVIASNLVRTLFCFKSSASLTENSIILSFVFTALARSQLFYYLFLYNFISQLNLQQPKDLSRTAFTQVLHQQNSSSTPWLGVKVSSSSFMFSYLWKGNRVLSNMPEPPGYLELISCGLHSSLERERNIRRRLITSSIKREIRHFHVVVVQRRQRNVLKAWRTCKVDGLLYKPITFLTFSLPLLSSFLKLPTNQGWLRLRRRSVGFGNHDGGSRGGAWGAPFLFLDQTEAWRAEKNFLGDYTPLI